MTLALLGVIVLSIGGLLLVVLNGRKLISDWPRPKPVHNVDLAWIQVYFGIACLVVAWIVATDPARKLFDPTPTMATPESIQSAQQQESAARSEGPPTRGRGR